MFEYKIGCEYFLWKFLEMMYVVPFIIIVTIALVKIRRSLAKVLAIIYLTSLIILLFIPVYTAELAFGFVFGLLVSIALYFGDKKTYMLVSAVIVGICLVTLMFSYIPCLIQGGYGYELSGEKMVLFTYPLGKVVIDLKQCEVKLTSSDEWKLIWRIYGYADQELRIGKFKLKNGKSAIVFIYRQTTPKIVINYSGDYYIISHPGVEKLYEEIIKIKKRI